MAIGGGTISLSTIAGEYGGSTPHSLSEYYRGGGLVPVVSTTASIPSSGTIDFQDFQNTSNTLPVDNVFRGTVGSFSYTSGKSTIQGAGMNSGGLGSLQDNSITTQNGSSNITVHNMNWSPLVVGLGASNIAYVSTSGGSNTTLGYTTWVVSNSASQFGQASSGSVSGAGSGSANSFAMNGYPSAGHVPATNVQIGNTGGFIPVVTSHNTPAQRANNGFTMTVTLG